MTELEYNVQAALGLIPSDAEIKWYCIPRNWNSKWSHFFLFIITEKRMVEQFWNWHSDLAREKALAKWVREYYGVK